MYTIKIVYNSLLENELKPLELCNILRAFIPNVNVEIYDENVCSKTRKKALQTKNMFGAKLVPFIGVYVDKKMVKGFYSEDLSCTTENILNYLIDTMKIQRDQIPMKLIGFGDRVKLLQKLRTMTKEEFLEVYPDDEQLYNDIQNSKVGHIKITKSTDNPGYLTSGEFREGYTPAFGEGLSCFIDGVNEYYYTSTIQSIDWEEKKFYTLNSIYEFEFVESSSTADKVEET